MATTTTNYGMTKPAYSDVADIADINGNMDIVDTALGAINKSIAIVANNNTHVAIAKGEWVYVRKHGTLAEGLYTAKSAISANATLSTSNLAADTTKGMANRIQENADRIEYIDTTTVISDLDNIPLNAKGRITLAAAVSPTGTQASFDFHCFGSSAYRALYIVNTYSNKEYLNTRQNSTTWNGWVSITDDISSNTSNIGTLSSLNTTAKNDLVSAANEIYGRTRSTYSTQGITWGNAYTTGDNPDFAIVYSGVVRNLRIRISPKNAVSGWVVVGTLSEFHRPRAEQWGVAVNDSDATSKRIRITTEGEITILDKVAGDYTFCITYIAKNE